MIDGAFHLDSAWYWRLFEGAPVFGDGAGREVARDFLRPLAGIAKGRVAIGDIEVDDDGDGVKFTVDTRPVAIRCRGLRVERFVDAINHSLAEATHGFVFAIVEARRYELRGVLVTRDELAERKVWLGLTPIG